MSITMVRPSPRTTQMKKSSGCGPSCTSPRPRKASLALNSVCAKRSASTSYWGRSGWTWFMVIVVGCWFASRGRCRALRRIQPDVRQVELEQRGGQLAKAPDLRGDATRPVVPEQRQHVGLVEQVGFEIPCQCTARLGVGGPLECLVTAIELRIVAAAEVGRIAIE